MLFSLSAHQTSWDQQSALRETASALRSSDDAADGKTRSAKRYGWEGASFLGMAAAVLVSMGWGLVGYLGIPGGGEKGAQDAGELLCHHVTWRTANIFSSLPINDGWIATARILVLTTLLATLSFSLHPARASLLRLFELPFAARGARSETARLRSRRKPRPSTGEVDDGESASSFEDLDRRKRARQRAWAERAVAVLAWTIVAIAAGGLLAGTEAETGEGIASAAEVLGAVGASVSGFLLPGAPLRSALHAGGLICLAQRSSSSSSSTCDDRGASSSPGRTRPGSSTMSCSCGKSVSCRCGPDRRDAPCV
jgi:hypothetical protein